MYKTVKHMPRLLESSSVAPRAAKTTSLLVRLSPVKSEELPESPVRV